MISRLLRWFTTAATGRDPIVTRVFVALTVGSMALALLPARLRWVENNHDVGHADSAAYAHQGRSLLEGRGLSVPYVSNFFHRYDSGITRHDDHWPLFPGLISAIGFRVLGVDAAHARMTMVVVGCLVLPLAVAWLVVVATGQAWTAIPGALLMLVPVAIARESTRILGDVSLAALLALFAASLLASQRRCAWLLASGFFGACAYLCKGSQLLLLPLLPLLALILHGPRILVTRWLLGGILVFMVVAFPLWHANAKAFGHPLHSTQNYVASYFGLQGDPWQQWDRHFYAVYWSRDLPSSWDRFTDVDRWAESVRHNTESYARAILLGLDARPADWSSIGPLGVSLRAWILQGGPLALPATRPLVAPVSAWPTWYTPLLGVMAMGWAVMACVLAPVAALVVIAVNAVRRRKKGSRLRVPAMLLRAVVLAMLLFFEIMFVACFWQALPRFRIAIMPLIASLALMLPAVLLHMLGRGAHALSRRLSVNAGKVLSHGRWITMGVLCAITTWMWVPRVSSFADEQRIGCGIRDPQRIRRSRYQAVADWVAANLPQDAVLMSRNPWELTFYCPPSIRAVGLPYARPEVIFAVARYYGVTHFIYDRERPGLREFLRRGHPAVTRVTRRPIPIYAIDYQAFEPGELADLSLGDVPLR
jgi:hypothetical protein